MASTQPRRTLHAHRPSRCGWLLAIGAAVLVVLIGTGPALAIPATSPAPAPPTPTSPAPAPPTPTSPATPGPAPVAPPTTAPVPITPTPSTVPGGPCDPGKRICGTSSDSDSDCNITNISQCVIGAMDGFFSGIVSSALNPLLNLLSTTLLATPDPATLPRLGALWTSSWQITVTVYGLLVMAAGILVMSYQTLQSRWSLREIAPGLVIGMLAAGLSFPLASAAVRAANAVSAAVAGNSLDPDSTGQALRGVIAATTGNSFGTFGLILALVLVVLVVALLVGYVIRITATIVLIVAAPLALMCHALPVTEPIARWWWRLMGACLAIQVVQSLTLITATRVFLTPGDWGLFGGSQSGAVDEVVAIALVGILVKIPFWMLSAMKIRQGHSMVGGMIRSYLTYKTFGLLGKGKGSPKGSRPRRTSPVQSSDPYARVQSDERGQLMLPLQGLKRVPKKPELPGPKPVRRIPGAPPSPYLGKQLALDLFNPHPPLPAEAPRPDGQRALFYATPVKKPPTRRPPAAKPKPTPSTASAPAASAVHKTPQGRQLPLRFPPSKTPPPRRPTPQTQVRDVYARPRSTAEGQYVLPLGVKKVRKPVPPPAPAWIAPPAPRPAGRQLHLPLPDLPVRRRRRRTDGGDAR